jgi:hypothetical protein
MPNRFCTMMDPAWFCIKDIRKPPLNNGSNQEKVNGGGIHRMIPG